MPSPYSKTQRNFGDPGAQLRLWKALGIGLTLLMLVGLGAFLFGIAGLRGAGGVEAWLALILGLPAAAGFGWLAAKAASRVEYLEGGLVRHKPKRASIIAGVVFLLAVAAMLWFWIFPWVDRTFVNRPAVGG